MPDEVDPVGEIDREVYDRLSQALRWVVAWALGAPEQNVRLRMYVLAALACPNVLTDAGVGDGRLADVARACGVSRQRVSDVALSLRVFLRDPDGPAPGRKAAKALNGQAISGVTPRRHRKESFCHPTT